MRLLQHKLNICNFNFLIMHVVPTRASNPQYKSINTFTEHQALNIRAKAHRASSPQRMNIGWIESWSKRKGLGVDWMQKYED
ncbi:hypothetical protein MTR_6g055417 [Medicago truncatula]|uniref:Uncharacterized protein n=1 Tax=Medicago truncatula TaxID=3880 RepID=A0A072UBL1_MEDTR|nr:hypothetical protein MTR_6g055417 [Medicago truncatula]